MVIRKILSNALGLLLTVHTSDNNVSDSELESVIIIVKFLSAAAAFFTGFGLVVFFSCFVDLSDRLLNESRNLWPYRVERRNSTVDLSNQDTQHLNVLISEVSCF